MWRIHISKYYLAYLHKKLSYFQESLSRRKLRALSFLCVDGSGPTSHKKRLDRTEGTTKTRH